MITQELYNQIHDELKSYLKREPTENEIMNGQADVNIMQKVRDKIYAKEKQFLQEQINILKK